MASTPSKKPAVKTKRPPPTKKVQAVEFTAAKKLHGPRKKGKTDAAAG